MLIVLFIMRSSIPKTRFIYLFLLDFFRAHSAPSLNCCLNMHCAYHCLFVCDSFVFSWWFSIYLPLFSLQMDTDVRCVRICAICGWYHQIRSCKRLIRKGETHRTILVEIQFGTLWAVNREWRVWFERTNLEMRCVSHNKMVNRNTATYTWTVRAQCTQDTFLVKTNILTNIKTSNTEKEKNECTHNLIRTNLNEWCFCHECRKKRYSCKEEPLNKTRGGARRMFSMLGISFQLRNLCRN